MSAPTSVPEAPEGAFHGDSCAGSEGGNESCDEGGAHSPFCVPQSASRSPPRHTMHVAQFTAAAPCRQPIFRSPARASC
eukprot:4164415-Alexandrium_andersonii.AAC.1